MGSAADPESKLILNVRYWPLSDILFMAGNVRFRGQADMGIALRNVR
jgi:hypothetical protein